MKKIGITQRQLYFKKYGETRDMIDRRLVDWVISAGFMPVPIPNNLVQISSSDSSQVFLEKWITNIGFDGFLLSGGGDSGDDTLRDITENSLIDFSKKNSIPILGICRGMQVLGMHDGAALEVISGHANSIHAISFTIKGSVARSKSVNSYHNFGFKTCPKSYNVVAISDDGCIEAMRHKFHNWEGWMWHPERERQFEEFDLENFRNLINND